MTGCPERPDDFPTGDHNVKHRDYIDTGDEEIVTDGGRDIGRTEQASLDVGDTRKPIAIKNERRVTSGDLAALAMCAHCYEPSDVGGWYTHEFHDVVRQWITSNVGSVMAQLSLHCEDTRGNLFELHPADDLWAGEVDTGPTQTTLVTDGGHETFECEECGDPARTEQRYRYLPAGQSGDDLDFIDLCPLCSTSKDSTRLFKPADGQDGDAE